MGKSAESPESPELDTVLTPAGVNRPEFCTMSGLVLGLDVRPEFDRDSRSDFLAYRLLSRRG